MSDFEQPIAILKEYYWHSIENVSDDEVAITFKPKPRKDFRFRISKADLADFVNSLASADFDGNMTLFKNLVTLDDKKGPDYSVYEGAAIYDTKPWEDE